MTKHLKCSNVLIFKTIAFKMVLFFGGENRGIFPNYQAHSQPVEHWFEIGHNLICIPHPTRLPARATERLACCPCDSQRFEKGDERRCLMSSEPWGLLCQPVRPIHLTPRRSRGPRRRDADVDEADVEGQSCGLCVIRDAGVQQAATWTDRKGQRVGNQTNK